MGSVRQRAEGDCGQGTRTLMLSISLRQANGGERTRLAEFSLVAARGDVLPPTSLDPRTD